MIKPKITMLCLCVVMLGACTSTGNNTLAASNSEVRGSQAERCAEDYYSASASARSRQSVADDCDSQRRNEIFRERPRDHRPRTSDESR